MDAGRAVSAAAEGVVTRAHDGEFDRCTTGDCAGGGGFGNHVYVEHPDGKTTIYAHLKQWTVSVAAGDPVTCGQLLGEVGSSGYSTGPHLHFEVRSGGGASEDPFDGPCNLPRTYWTGQGSHGDLPEPLCASVEPCAPAATLVCGERRSTSNDGPGSVQVTWRYGCDDFVYSGPEQVYAFTTALDQPVTLRVNGLTADLDLHVMDDPACDGTGCVAASSHPNAEDEELTFDAIAGAPYVVVVDGWEGAVSSFTLEVDCAPDPAGGDTAAPPDPDTGGTEEPVTDAPEETGALGGTPPDLSGGPEGGVIGQGDQDSACGCATPGGIPVGAALVGLAALRSRRRSR
jgi:uncharacterized protein (TIGR03382 family)